MAIKSMNLGWNIPTLPLAPLTDGFYTTDHQGSIIAQSNNSGLRIYNNAYDQFGIAANTNLGRFGYTGQLSLKEIGLNYYKARIYSPTLGRFLQTDPIGYKDDMDLYSYVGNDPINKTDPTGLTAYDCSQGLGKGNCNGTSKVKDGDTIKYGGKTYSATSTGNIIYREVGSLRPTTEKGAGSQADLDAGSKAIAHVINNRQKSGNTNGVADNEVKLKYALNPQFANAQSAAAKAAAEKDTTNGAKYYILNYNQALTGWINHTHVEESFGPFKNAGGGGDVTQGATTSIEIRQPDSGYN